MVGCGLMALRHLEALKRMPTVSVTAFCDLIRDKAEMLAQEHEASVYTDATRMIEEEELDAVHILFPPFAHGPAELTAVEKRLPFFVDKPLGNDLGLCREIAAAVEDANLLTSVGYHNRYRQGVQHVKNIFETDQPVLAYGGWITGIPYQYGHQVAIVGKVMGPWTLSYHPHGLQDFLIKTITNTKMVRCFLDKLKEVSVLFGIAQIRAGADILCIADHATGDLVGPWTYRDFLLEYHKELSLKLGCPTVLHICGDTLDRLDYICDSGFDAFHFDSKVDAKSAVNKAAGRISLIGNINNTEILLNGSEDQVVEQTQYALEAGVQVIGPECAIPLHTSQ
ncbi:MAG: uroporphyrinogen decarboxylase family protein [Anaerolineales bacterium]